MSRNVRVEVRPGVSANSWQSRRACCGRRGARKVKENRGRRSVMVDAKVDYSASAGDIGSVLERPPKTPLEPWEITHVFDYPRDLNERSGAMR